MKLRTNLASRPFYNVRAVHVTIGAFALVVLALTAFNVVQLVRLTSSQGTLGARAAEAEREAQRLRGEATRIRTQINQKELEAVATAAREANSIIDRRAFSWTELLTQLEATLPDDVRITTVRPRLDKDIFKVGVIAEARRAEDVASFIEALEKTGAFRNVVPLEQHTDDTGLIQVAIEGDYQAQTPRGGTGE
jgi:Tfp pilus assembly protein PilN